MRRRLLFLLAAPVLALFSVSPASATGPGPWNISESSGSYWVGASDLNSGTAVWEASGPRDMYWNPTGSTYFGDGVGHWQFSDGFMMRASNNCGSVYITATATDNGTAWALHFANGHVYIINRYCDQQIGGGGDTVALAGRDVLHQQFFLSSPSGGIYRAFDLDPG